MFLKQISHHYFIHFLDIRKYYKTIQNVIMDDKTPQNEKKDKILG